MHANIEPVQLSGLSASGTIVSVHVLTVHETKGKDHGSATVGYDFRDEQGTPLAKGSLAMSGEEYADDKADDAEVLGWLCGKLGFVAKDAESDPAPERTVDEQTDPESTDG